MKIAKSQLKQIIGEEVQKLDEIPTWLKIVQRRNRPRPEPEEPEEELSDEQKQAEIDKLLSHLYTDREKVEQELEAGKSVRDILSYPWVRKSKLIKHTLIQIAKLKGEKIHHSLREETFHKILKEERQSEDTKMKITTSQLKQLLKEEIEEALKIGGERFTMEPPHEPAKEILKNVARELEKVENLDTISEEEAMGVLDILIDGMQEMLHFGGFGAPSPVKEVSSEKQRRWACAQKDKPASSRKKSLSAAEAEEMCKSQVEEK